MFSSKRHLHAPNTKETKINAVGSFFHFKVPKMKLIGLNLFSRVQD